MPIFDPASVARQIDAYVASIPPGKKVVLVGNADLTGKKLSLGVATRLAGDLLTAYARVTKPLGQKLEADAGFKVSFLVEEAEESFSYTELVKLLRYLGQGFWRAHLNAAKLALGGEVDIDPREVG